MKRLACLLMLALIATACQRSDTREKDREIPKAGTPEVTAESPAAPILPWIAVVDEKTGKISLKANPIPKRGISPQQVVEAANIRHPQIRLQFVKMKKPVVYVRIKDARYLTQQIGSTGARVYMAEITYSLTQIKGITTVNFSFTEGDHASPGDYTRQSFAGFN